MYEEPLQAALAPVKLFSVAELGVMLPCRIYVGDNQYDLCFQKYDEDWARIDKASIEKVINKFWYEYDHVNSDGKIKVLDAKQTKTTTEAQARAEMLIFLLEKKYITAPAVNTRLNNA